MRKPDLVVVARQHFHNAQVAPRHCRSRLAQWTLHYAVCQYVNRENSRTVRPAPDRPYPGTVACKTCRPPTPQEGATHGPRQ